mmetsp:Transcript_117/g.255  ORF Transcript_117/g.255 Transcript_117/m.255 type:complete len:473 (+) Transcript_117:147-1565(+)
MSDRSPQFESKHLINLSQDLSRELLFDEQTSDVHLLVEDASGENSLLPAHKAILAARSPVFKAMFFGSMLECRTSQVKVSTFSLDTVRALLQYLYTGMYETDRVTETVGLMACADHYGAVTLKDALAQQLQETIAPETACTVLAVAGLYNQEFLQEKYLKFILTNAQEVTRCNSFLHLDIAILSKVVMSDDTRIDEVDLFKALVRWYRNFDEEAKAFPDYCSESKSSAARALFSSIRYCQMTGQELVTEVKPLAGDLVPQELYIAALERVAAPEQAAMGGGTVLARRKPPVGGIEVSDSSFLSVLSSNVRKVGAPGWNCTAIIDPSTACTRFTIEWLSDPANGIGVAVFDQGACNSVSQRSVPSLTTSAPAQPPGFPNPNQWGSDCLAGIYGSGCFFGIITEHVVRWHSGLVIEVTLTRLSESSFGVAFTTEGATEDDCIRSEGQVEVTHSARLALALYSPEDKVNIECQWS